MTQTGKIIDASLRDYVARRNGVPLGANGALENMLARSLGAGSFQQFWQYWNPIWGYYLGRYIFKPLLQLLPAALALILTFAVSGALHDLAISLLRWEIVILCTPWFLIMGALVVLTRKLSINYRKQPWPIRALANTALIGIAYFMAQYLKAVVV